MRSLLRTIPLIGALLISAVPVQAFPFLTFEEVEKACHASEENTNLCVSVAEMSAMRRMVILLCNFEAKGRITKEDLDLTLDEWTFNQSMSMIPLLNKAVEMTLKEFPECSLNP
ncbi:hypothetical protein [Synechococcus sp. CC9616]|uniref:hypothetical protein n=1 Tax=Synechococcus sp. CC9616 TaxID=110663 RepID=UPI0012EC4044|nr:hypothetical protein [Synechococcus sp. CC9616]